MKKRVFLRLAFSSGTFTVYMTSHKVNCKVNCVHALHTRPVMTLSTFHLMFKDFQDRSSHVETKAAHESAEQRQPQMKVWWQKI